MKLCNACCMKKPEEDFSQTEWRKRSHGHERRCSECVVGNVDLRPNAEEIYKILTVAHEVEAEDRPHADVPQEALYLAEAVSNAIDKNLYTEGHGWLMQCIRIRIVPDRDERGTGIIAGFRNTNGSKEVGGDTLFRVVFVDLNDICYQNEYTMDQLLSSEYGIASQDIMDGLQDALTSNWIGHVTACPFPAAEEYAAGRYSGEEELDDDGFLLAKRNTPYDLGAEIKGDTEPMEEDRATFDFRQKMLEQARKAPEGQYGAVSLKHGSVAILNKWGGGVEGNTQHGVSANPTNKKNHILAMDLSVLPKGEWEKEALEALEQAKAMKAEGKMGDEVAKGYEVKEGSREYIEELLEAQSVSFGWEHAFKDLPQVNKVLHEMHYPDKEKKKEGLFVCKFLRGAATSGRNSRRTLSILKEHEPFRTFLERIERSFAIRQCWVLANLSGEHGFHQDSFVRGATHRMIITLGSSGKLMWFMEPY